jgi:hypothetical protein
MGIDDVSDDGTQADIIFLSELVAEGVDIDGEVEQIGVETWAIHAHVSYDGEIIVAEEHTAEQARFVIDQAVRPHRGDPTGP